MSTSVLAFELQDYTRTSFADANFDVVWAIESVCHAADKRLFLAEARRLLRPGGRLGIFDPMRAHRPYVPVDERWLHDWLSGLAIFDLVVPDELVRWSGKAGFTDVQFVDVTRNVRPSLHRLYWIATLCFPGALAVRALGLRSATQHGNTRAARAQYFALRRGLWCFGMLTATAR